MLTLVFRVNSNLNHCSFSELPSVAAAAAADSLVFDISRCRTTQFATCFLPAKARVWNDLPNTVFDTGTFDRFMGAVNCWLLP